MRPDPARSAPLRLGLGPTTTAWLVGGRVLAFGAHPHHVPYRNEGPGPVEVAGIRDAVQVLATRNEVIVLRERGAVVEVSEEAPRGRMVRVPPMRFVAAQGPSRCGAARDGSVHCWGVFLNEDERPQRIPGVRGARAVALRSAYVGCALTEAGAVLCFGEGSSAELGTGDSDESLERRVATPIGLGSGVVQLVATASATCALLSEGTVRCWGQRFDEPLRTAREPTEIAGLDGVVSLHAGEETLCARRRDGTVACLGEPIPGLTPPEAHERLVRPTLAVPLRGATDVAIGTGHACWLDGVGDAYCVGRNTLGEVGALPRRGVNLEVTGVRAAWVAVRGRVSCAGGPAGAWCWDQTPRPIALPHPGDVRSAWLDTERGCVLRDGGRLECYEGLSGSSPRLVATLEEVEELAGTCVRLRGGSVRCGLGLQTHGEEPRTTELPGGPFRRIAGGASQVCGLTLEGDLACARLSSGSGLTLRVERTRRVSAVGQATHLTASTCALRGGRATCWIGGPPRELGAFDEIAGQDGLGCGRRGGHVLCWGWIDSAQLMVISGEGHPDAGPLPTPVPGLEDATAIAVGAEHGCALRADATVACWSSTSGVGLGVAPPTVHTTPVRLAAP